MNWTQIEGKWADISGQFRQKWGKLTNDDLMQIKGRRDRLVGKLKEHYGETREVIEQKVDDFIDGLWATDGSDSSSDQPTVTH